MQSDIVRQFQSYITERSSDVEKVIDINMKSLTLYDIKQTGTGDTAGQLIIPTQVTTIQTYNFNLDPNHILSAIKDSIIGKSAQDVQDTIKTYDQINTATLNINPFRLNQVPTTKSRIFFTIK
ncbi:MAG: hypothetical protein H6766_00590 [Candidatus Peribacteria bacterium]|nr:MAG: hypothetical protein H6766_00590 [Candidatus Peribacteria bacterium]